MDKISDGSSYKLFLNTKKADDSMPAFPSILD